MPFWKIAKATCFWQSRASKPLSSEGPFFENPHFYDKSHPPTPSGQPSGLSPEGAHRTKGTRGRSLYREKIDQHIHVSKIYLLIICQASETICCSSNIFHFYGAIQIALHKFEHSPNQFWKKQSFIKGIDQKSKLFQTPVPGLFVKVWSGKQADTRRKSNFNIF